MTQAAPSPDGTTYPVRFASPRRDSVVAARAHAEGTIAWSHDLPDGAAPVRELLLWRGQVVTIGATAVTLHDKEGRPLWTRTRRAESPVAVGNGNLYFETPSSLLTAVRPDNTPSLQDAPLPGIGGRETFLGLLWPRAHDFVVGSTMPDPTYDSEDTAVTPTPKLYGLRVEYGSRFGGWNGTWDGTQTLPPLFVPETSRWLGSVADVVSVDVDSGREKRFALPLEHPLQWSADAAGMVAVTGTRGAARVLVAVDGDGKERWRHEDAAAGEPWAPEQPPIGSAAGRLVVLTTQRVLAFDAGKPAWTYDAASESLRHGAEAGDGTFEVRDGRLLSTGKLRYGTALADGAVAVVGNQRLWLIDANGRRLFVLKLPDEVVAPPVVDADGAIYVATAKRLFKIR